MIRHYFNDHTNTSQWEIPTPRASKSPVNTSSLNDYQMQAILLEQQNKKKTLNERYLKESNLKSIVTSRGYADGQHGKMAVEDLSVPQGKRD